MNPPRLEPSVRECEGDRHADDVFVWRVLRATQDLHDQVWWTVDNDDGSPVAFYIDCTGVFYAHAGRPDFGTAKLSAVNAVRTNAADAVRLGDWNLVEFEKACADADGAYGPILFCARVRKMRPLPTYLQRVPEHLRPLFDAAGPPREKP